MEYETECLRRVTYSALRSLPSQLLPCTDRSKGAEGEAPQRLVLLLGFRCVGASAGSKVVSVYPPVGFCPRSLHQSGQPVGERFQLRSTPLGRNTDHDVRH